MAKKKKKVSAPTVGYSEDGVISLSGMYQEYFLDYASYVILERAIPLINDGLKPVQRRLLHAIKEMDDGRFNKVANIIGQTMQYHPHGDASIGSALVKLGQKDLLIDTQGNWGDMRTGDSAAASRYIEARLTKFALDVAFNNQTTDWQISYDGRKKEPIALPMKFPLLLAQGAEGIAVGLSTKILPHNFIELIKASIKILEGKRFKIYPDFATGGMIDVTEYNKGKRGGKVKIRAKIETVDKTTLAIKELPFGVTTTNLIDSIIKANDKGKIKIKKVTDNTAEHVEILIELASGISTDQMIDALYAFTNCEVSVSPNACVVVDEKPHFLTVDDILINNTQLTKSLLLQELKIKEGELDEKWHFASLEKIFIEKRIYRDIEEAESFEAVIKIIAKGLKKYFATPKTKKASDKRIKLRREITQEDIERLTEIRIKRISKYNKFKADELIAKLEADLKEVKQNIKNITKFAINYFENLLEKYGKGKERKTEITTFETIKRQQVIINNAKLYVNRKDGFVGTGLKKDEFISECSDIADIIAINKQGKLKVVRAADKVFVGKNVLHAAVWKKADDRTTYNMIYVDAKTGKSFAKRFNVTGITRDKEYDLASAAKGSKIHYLTVNPNGESETVTIQLSQGCTAKKKVFEFDFAELDIKGRGSKGNTVTKYPIRKVSQAEVGMSTLGAIKLWMDEVSGKLNRDERGKYLGEFDTGDYVLTIYNDGTYELNEMDFNKKFDAPNMIFSGRWDEEVVINALYYDGKKKWTMAKRFQIETGTLNQRFSFITDAKGSSLFYATTDEDPSVQYSYKDKKEKIEEILDIAEFIDVKGWKALGNKVCEGKISGLKEYVEEDDEDDED